MKLLTRIIRAMSKEEVRSFRLFADRIQSEKYDKKQLDLFDFIRQERFEENDKSLVKNLYPTHNTNAFYRLKNRLIEDLERSLLLQYHKLDDRVKVIRFLHVGRIFLFKSEYSVSHEYFLKAAKLARKMRFLDLELTICEELQTLSNYYQPVDLPALIKYKGSLLEKKQESHRIDSLLGIISFRLKQSNFDGRNHQLLPELEKIQRSLELLPEQQDPELSLKINKCVREVLLEKKEFVALENYLLESYKQYLSQKLFHKNNHKEKIVILSWIVNTLTKNRQFETSLEYTHELLTVLKEQNGLHFHQYIWTYYQGLIANYSGSGNPQKAIKLLNKIKEEMSEESIPSYHLFVSLNLARLHFDMREYAQATIHLNQMLHREVFQSMEVSLRLTVSLAEIILRLEMRDWDYANHRTKEFKRKYRLPLQKGGFITEARLLAILRHFGRNMSFRIDKKLSSLLEEFLLQTEYEVGGNEFISYKAWVYAKLHQRDYYEVILEWLKP